jgi:hypothetical protein
MTVETKRVKSGFYSDFEVGTLAAMTMDAGVEAAAVGIVMVAGETVHGRMFTVIEIQGQSHRASQQGFPKSHVGATRDKRSERQHRGDDDAHDECRMPPECEAASRSGLVRRRSRAAPAPEQHRNAADRDGKEKHPAAVAPGKEPIST